MDELQARFRAMRSLQTDMNLAKQAYPEFEDSDEELEGEANVVEMPNRQVHDAPTDRSPGQRSTTKRKQGTAAKRKPSTAGEKAFSFRQMRDGHQQPYIDELKRLEAQAERINQLLAERKRKKAYAEQAELSSGTSSPPSTSSQPRKKATRSSKQPARSSQREVSPMPTQDDDTEALEAQAERIKQLLKELETALNEAETLPTDDAIASRSPDEHPQAGSSTSSVPPPSPPSVSGVEPFSSGTYRYGATVQSFADSHQPMPSDTDPKAQQEATETAQALRSLASRDGGRGLVDPASAATHHPEVRRTMGRSRATRPVAGPLSSGSYGLQLQQLLRIPPNTFDKVGDAVLWIVLAAVIRVGAKLILAMAPALTPIFVLLMFAPAALAVYLAMFVPRAGFVSIYRLFLIMLGLLLGGRL